jgi:transposase
MRKLKITDAQIMRIAVQNEILRSEQSRYDHRLHGILLACSGYSSYQIADLLGHSPRTIQYWIKGFEKSGFAGLEDQPRAGRPACMDEAMCQAIGKDLRKSPRDFGYSQNLWDGKLLSYHLAKAYNAKIGTRQCQRLFHKLGFRRRKPRPVIANADPEAQSRYKKTPPTGKKGRHRPLV